MAAKLIRKTKLEKRIGQESENNVAKSVQKLVFYILMVAVLLVVLEIMGISNVLGPLEVMLGKFLAFIPNIVGAVVIGFAGYIIASIASELVALASGAIERFSRNVGFNGDISFTKIVKQLVFLIVFIPILIQAIDALQMKAISEPATMMLSQLINAIPNIIAAALIIAVFFIGGKYVTNILGTLLSNLGVDKMSTNLGLNKIFGNQSLSTMLANIAFFFIVFSGVIAAIEKLNFLRLTEVLRDLFEMTGQIFFGLIVMAIGNFISVLASQAISRAQGSSFLASVVRVATLALFLAIALRMMGIANEIVELAFGLTLGSVAVAVALSFGLGGREAAGKQMEHILKKFRNEE